MFWDLFVWFIVSLILETLAIPQMIKKQQLYFFRLIMLAHAFLTSIFSQSNIITEEIK